MIKRSWHFAIRSLLIAGLLSITYISFFAISDVHAASSREGESAHPNLQSASGHATIIVLDMSGSMGQNDSHGYRCSAADAYIDLSGVNDYIGLIGLDNNNGLRIGNHDFESAQTWTTEPLSTATVQDQKNLKSIIASKSRNCRPDNTTPTYDALSKAYDMLNTITKQQDISGGSVILLTDGVPCPDVDAQINAIKSDLLPEFQAHNWPIDTIGLGQDAPISSGSGCTSPGTLSGTFHDFLKGISNATGGQFYDDGNGPVQGVSPLNIAGFFVDIFAKYSGETPKLAISPTPLNGGTFQRNFDVVGGSTKLDVVAVKDNAGIGVTLLNPDSQPVSSGTSGVTSSQDNYHVIYSITQPQAGKWIVNASGTGEFLLYSLQRTKIGLANIGVQLQDSSLAAPQALPLGQTLIVTAQLTLNDQPLSDRQYSLNGSINPVGSGAECSNVSNSFTLSGNASTYTGQVSVPANSAVGTYDVLICASTGTLQNVVASKSFPVRLEIFPIPKFVSPQTNQLTDTQISTTVVQWPLPLQLLYSIPLIDRLSSWPLQGHPAQPYANLSGQVEWNGQLYRGANIKATMSKVNSGV
ncbi:MAG TPA: vWA domain-containing protein, partial [Ktedonobacteraceae bacterium]|nr:vWA domain-containing protein [Ktedonobacteraceae bacterium]